MSRRNVGVPAGRGRIFGKLVAGFVVTVLLGASLFALAPATTAQALSGSSFMPGLIISDSEFYNGSAMDQSQIQDFLASKGSGLAGYTFTVASRPAIYASDGVHLRCNAFQGGTLIPASTIIYRAEVACGISAKVILVTLQKEQGLITAHTPSQGAMDRAMGYACPDTAPCAPTTLGFGNQIYSAALQLVTYKLNHVVRQPGVQAIAYSPKAVCGSSTINIQNYATAALYNYTPYQPDAAALANLSGTGDSCSSYGNRNFWVYYNSWFGSTLGPIAYPVVNPSISGSTTLGDTLTATPGNWAGSPTFTYAWLTCTSPPGVITDDAVPSYCSTLLGTTTTSYVTVPGDVGHYIAVLVTGTNSFGSFTGGIGMTAAVGTPVNVAPPTVSGATAVGSMWTVNPGTWKGTPTPTLVYFWLRCNQPVTSGFTTVPAGCVAISGANSTTYMSTLSDLGKYLTAQVAGNGPFGFALAVAVSVTPVGFPANAMLPTVSGTPSVGSTWTANPGTWTGTPAPTFGIFWLRCDHPVASGFTTVPSGCVAISDANAATYTVTPADIGNYLTVQVAGDNSMGFALAGAVNNTAIQAQPLPANTAPPTVSGSSLVGSTWTVNTGTWTGSPTFVIFWLRCNQPVSALYTTVPSGCTAISGANATTYVSTTADAGKYLTAQLAGTNSQGFTLAGTVNTTPTQAAAPTLPANTAPPTVSGSSLVGSTWTVNTGTWTGSPTFVIFWLRCNQPVSALYTTVPSGCTAISGANATTYVSTTADAGKYLTAQLAGTNSQGFTLAGTVNTTPTQAAAPTLPANTAPPTVSGSSLVGSTWTVNTGTWTGSPTFVIFWLRCNQPVSALYTTVPSGCTAISGANATTYVSTTADAGKYLTAQLAGTNSQGFTLAGTVNTTPTQAAAPTLPANTAPPTVSGSSLVGSTWTVNTGTWTGSPTFVIFWLRCNQPVSALYTTVPSGCTAISGANATTYVSTTADAGKYLTAQLAGTNSQGFTLAGTVNTTPTQG